MCPAKLHHYVPQFYLRRFENEEGYFWAWDKMNDKLFCTTPRTIGAESDFCKLHEFADLGRDPLTMEKQFAHLEGQVSIITNQWLRWLGELSRGDRIEIPRPNRKIISLYMALQFFRTADTKDFICTLERLAPRGELSDEDRRHIQAVYLWALELAKPSEKRTGNSAEKASSMVRLSDRDKTRIHTQWLWDLDFINTVAKRIQESIWIFGRNLASCPFFTSDNPVAFKTGDNRRWVKIGFLAEGTYIVFPLSPQIVMYCHDRHDSKWRKIAKYSDCLSPVEFDVPMVEHENAGQVFNAERFVISPLNDFKFAREFAQTIGTDRYAPR
jgi:hypothetical protein